MRVLAIDDAEELLLLIQLVLEQKGWTVDTAVDGREALAKVPQGYDVILVDKNLPDMGDLELINAIRSIPAGAQAKLIQMTGETEAETAEGSLGVLEKPFDPGDLGDSILRLLN